MKVKEVAELVGISVRTLHYYDEIGLLTPDDVTESGYRLYSERNLEELQQILFFRQLDFPLKEIKHMMASPNYDKITALKLHKDVLKKKRDNITTLIKTIDKTILHEKGEITMSNKEKFSGFDFDNNKYEEEARERWGDQAVNDSNARMNALSKGEKEQMGKEFENVFKELAQVRHLSADSDEAQKLIQKWWNYLNRIGTYSVEAFQGLGEMYVADERFTENIDQYGEGLAEFMCEAMRIFAEKHDK